MLAWYELATNSDEGTNMKNRLTGAEITVVDNRDRSFMDDDQDWYTCCDTHSELCGHATRKLAYYHARVPEWCSQCLPLVQIERELTRSTHR